MTHDSGRPTTIFAPGTTAAVVRYQVQDVDRAVAFSTVAALTRAGARFRNAVEVGPGGKQILVDDPDGNPVELHEGPRE